MHCPSCGEQIPDQSTFCLHCGTHIAVPTVAGVGKSVIEWEYKDFIYTWPRANRPWARISGGGAYTEPGARLKFWQDVQADIRRELQKWLDEGWEPVGEVGPSSIVLHKYRSYGKSCIEIIVFFIALLPTLGLWLIVGLDSYAEPEEFRVQMRRPKT